MRLDHDGTTIRIALSRRNLKILLAKLDGHPADSACTIAHALPYGRLLMVKAEENDVHYAHPERESGPGPMHPDSEARLNRHDPARSESVDEEKNPNG